MVNKAGGGVEHEAYDFLERVQASAGMSTDYERLDFFGHPIQYPVLKGIDLSNRRVLKLDDPAYAEFSMLNRLEGLALVMPKPDAVFKKADWVAIGVNDGGLLTSSKVPTLHKVQTRSGENAWAAYRRLVYKGRFPKEAVQKATSSVGDRMDVGRVEVRPNETFETAMRRMIKSSDYQSMTPNGRTKVWKATFAIFKKASKDFLADMVDVDPSTFENSTAGSPIDKPTSIKDTLKAGKSLMSDTQRTKGTPLDTAFSIK